MVNMDKFTANLAICSQKIEAAYLANTCAKVLDANFTCPRITLISVNEHLKAVALPVLDRYLLGMVEGGVVGEILFEQGRKVGGMGFGCGGVLPGFTEFVDDGKYG